MTIRPFHFNLKKVSSRNLSLLEAIWEFLPATGLRDSLQSTLKDTLKNLLSEDVSFELSAIHEESFSSFLAKLPKNSVMAIVGLSPLRHKAVLEIDSPLAALVIEKILGGEAKRLPEPKVLSETEQGILQYILAELFHSIHKLSGKDERVHFRFDRFAFASHEVRDLAEPDAKVSTLVFRVIIGQHSGFLRLILPDPFVEAGFLSIKDAAEMKTFESCWLAKRFEKFGYVKTSLWAEAGKSTITQMDLKDLEVGDVVIFDESNLSISRKKPVGDVTLRVGYGRQGGFDAKLVTKNSHVCCEIKGVHKGE